MISLVSELARSDVRENTSQPLGRRFPVQTWGSTQIAQVFFRLLMPLLLRPDLLARALMQYRAIREQHKGTGRTVVLK